MKKSKLNNKSGLKLYQFTIFFWILTICGTVFAILFVVSSFLLGNLILEAIAILVFIIYIIIQPFLFRYYKKKNQTA
jgi:hypothetical protein